MQNREMVARSLAAIWHPCTQMKSHERFPLVPIAHAKGVWLHDFEGRRYVDGVSSWWVNLFGHSHPAINAAIAEQLASLEHVMLAGFTHAPAVELAEKLKTVAPGGLGHAFFASDGASATEIALKMAFHYWANRGRTRTLVYVRLVSVESKLRQSCGTRDCDLSLSDVDLCGSGLRLVTDLQCAAKCVGK